MPGMTPYEFDVARQAISSIPPERMAIPQVTQDAITRQRSAIDAANYTDRMAVERDITQRKFDVDQDKKYLDTVRKQYPVATAIGVGNVAGTMYGSLEEYRSQREQEREHADLMFHASLMRDIVAKGVSGEIAARKLPENMTYNPVAIPGGGNR